jgi:hypothetical protein
MFSFSDKNRFNFKHFNISHPLGSPRKANIFRTRGCFADMLFKPMPMYSRYKRYWGKTLNVSIDMDELERNISWKIQNPSNEDIKKALRIIEKGDKWSYVILSRPENGYYIQTDVFALEYRNGTENEHYFCPPEYLTSELVLDTFLSYAEESPWWQENVIWKKGYGI